MKVFRKIPLLSADQIGRFWQKVNKSDGCWEYQGFRLKSGYGLFRVGTSKFLAHRISYTLEFGDFDSSLSVCHRCDNGSCVRPDHLFLGSHLENMKDMTSKGRCRSKLGPELHMPGERHPSAKLTAENVRSIRTLSRQGNSQRKIAAMFGISRGSVGGIIRGKIWTSVK